MDESMISSTVYSTEQSSNDATTFQIDLTNLPDEYQKRRLFTFSCIGIVINFFLLAYIGPTPWSQQMKYEKNELTVFYYAFDILSILVCTLSLMFGLSRRILSNSEQVRNFKHKIFVFTIIYILSWIILLFKVHLKYNEWLGFTIRGVAIMINGLIWYQAKQLESILSISWKD